VARSNNGDHVAFAARGDSCEVQREDADTARLITRIQAGELEGFAVLYERYFDRVYGYLRVLLKDDYEAEDLAQQVFIKLLEGIDRYERRRQPFRAWLFVVIRNCARDHLRSQARVSAMDPSELGERQERAALAAGETGQHASVAAELRTLAWLTSDDLAMLVERLPQVQRQVLALHFLLGMPAADIGRALGVSANHVSVLQYRALGFLRERLKSLGLEPAPAQGTARSAASQSFSTTARPPIASSRLPYRQKRRKKKD
jgi:RNA polymerase sigma-70 factor (ECF subfamily)